MMLNTIFALMMSIALTQSGLGVEHISENKNTTEVKVVSTNAVKFDEKEEFKIHMAQVNNKRTKHKQMAKVEKKEEWLLFEISAYTNGYESTHKRKGDKDFGRTASGKITQEGRTISADDDLFPFGTVLYLEGIGKRTVEDTGNKIKGYKLDLFIEDLQEARNFGRKYNVRVKVIKMGVKKEK